MSLSISKISNEAIIYKSDDAKSFMRTLAVLVARIYATFSEFNQKERKEIHQLELSYKQHSFQSADLMRSRGKIALVGACFNMLFFAGSFAFRNTNDMKFVQLVSQQAPEVSKLFENSREAEIRSTDALAQLENTRMLDKNNKSQSDGNIKEQFAQALQAEIQRLRSASASAG